MRSSRLAALGLIYLLHPSLLGQTITRGPYVQLANEDSVSLVWYTDIPVETCVRTGRDCSSLTELCDRRQVARHEIRITGLAPATAYCYQIRASGRALNRIDGKDRFRFQTNKPRGPFRFLAFADFGTGSAEQLQLARRMREVAPAPDFIIAPGDLIYPTGEDINYTAFFFEPYKDLIERIAVYPSIGNHDNYSERAKPYLNIFSLPQNGPEGIPPERNYSFNYGNAFFASVDSDIPTREDQERLRNIVVPWLARSLEQTTARWKVVFFHHAPFSSGPNQQYPDIPVIRAVLPPVLSAKGVDIVFNGHDHIYERTKPIDGTVYIVTGAAGHVLYPKKFQRDYTEVFSGGPNASHSFTVVDIDQDRLTLKQIDRSNCVIDTLILQKAAAWGDTWRYWKGLTAAGEKWMERDFDDSGWQEGSDPFGYGVDNLGTVLSDMRGSYVTVYTRRKFSVSNASDIKGAILKVDWDDAFRCYVNGVEVATVNAGAGGNHETPANGWRDSGKFETFTVEAGLLRDGENVIACEVKNFNLESSDLFLHTELIFSYTEPSKCAPDPQSLSARPGRVKP